MPIVLKSEVLRAYMINGELICVECVKDHENATGKGVEDFITTGDIERDDKCLYYCDSCGELLL